MERAGTHTNMRFLPSHETAADEIGEDESEGAWKFYKRNGELLADNPTDIEWFDKNNGLTVEYSNHENDNRHLACYKHSSLNCIHNVVDGDTLNNDGQRIRLYGIDAPELLQFCKDENKNKYPCG